MLKVLRSFVTKRGVVPVRLFEKGSLKMPSDEGAMSTSDEQYALRTVWWEEDTQQAAVCMLDQSLLPQQVIVLHLTHEQQVADAIATLKVRGAPAIGVTAALGMLLALRRFLHEWPSTNEWPSVAALQTHLIWVGQLLRSTRPTAVNLSWAVERMLHCVDKTLAENADPQSPLRFLQARPPAKTIHVAVLFPGVQLPTIDDLFPFCRQEPVRKLMALPLFLRLAVSARRSAHPLRSEACRCLARTIGARSHPSSTLQYARPDEARWRVAGVV